MARIAVVAFDIDCVSLADNMTFGRQSLGKSAPIIRLKRTILQAPHFIIESSERRGITTAERPCHRSPCAAIKGIDDPKLVFF
jgi:hypothetical protein